MSAIAFDHIVQGMQMYVPAPMLLRHVLYCAMSKMIIIYIYIIMIAIDINIVLVFFQYNASINKERSEKICIV